MKQVKLIALFAVLILFPVQQGLAATLVGYWPFEEPDGAVVFDQSGFANHGELSGAIRSIGRVGRGLSFAGVGGVTIQNSVSLDSLPGGLTMSAWIMPTSFGDFASIFFKTDRVTREFLHFQTNSRLHIGINTDPFTWTAPNQDIELNEWQFVTWTFDEMIHRLYVNGEEVFTVPFIQPWDGNDELLYIGEHPQIPSAQFVGFIDEARIYRGAQTHDEILRDFHGQAIPEPSTLLLSIMGIATFFARRFVI